jgi:hypothetical protein
MGKVESDKALHNPEKVARAGPKCVDCGGESPQTNTNYTLISRQHGWRLTLEHVDGRRVAHWRCPRCWDRHRKAPGRPVP